MKTILLFLLIPLSIIPTYVASLTESEYVQVWAMLMMTFMMIGFFGGITSLDDY